MNKYFSRTEFTCRCGCGKDPVDAELLAVLIKLRKYFSKPIWINSANRCYAHNLAVGGGKKSQHLLSKAADIEVKGIEPKQVFELLDGWFPDKYGMGEYENFTHIDVRTIKARW